MECRLPALVTVVKQINDPRHAGLRGVMKARKAEITKWTAEDLEADVTRCGLSGSPTNVLKVFAPTRHAKGELIKGEVTEAAAELYEKLRAAQVL